MPNSYSERMTTRQTQRELVHYYPAWGDPVWLDRLAAFTRMNVDHARWERYCVANELSDEQRDAGAPRITGLRNDDD